MAQCYHDEQDFKSDLHIEVAREGDIIREGHDLDKFKCKKNPGHSGFIPFKDLTLEHLPEEIRNTETFENIKKWGKYVVRLVVKKLRNRRVVRECGTGLVFRYGNKHCIKTNNHVVKNDNEAQHCEVTFFYDSHDTTNVKIGEGVKLLYTCPYRDLSVISFEPVPEFYLSDLKDPLLFPPSIVIQKDDRIVTCRSTRICTTKFFYYTSENLNNPQINMMCISLADDSISYFKSSYFKFQPIPPNIQELSRIEIHIEEKEGYSRVMPGDVVQFGDDYVVKIAESIFQKDVKKCALVRNGEVIGRGTRLYFQHVTPIEFLSDIVNMGEGKIDVELFLKNTAPNIWLFDFHPQPKGAEEITEIVKDNNPPNNVVCCIGHPHGAIKMVTFGRLLEQKLERFDDKYRRVTQPGTDCKEINCVKYSCKTCAGSSGCTILIPNKVYNMMTSIVHFLGERVEECLPDGKLIENKNMGWC